MAHPIDRDRLCRIDYGPPHAGCNVTHDGSGNVVSQPMRGGGVRTFTYFPSGAVRSIDTATATAQFRYDGSGEISELDVDGPTDARRDRRYGLIERRNVTVNGSTESILVRQIPGAGGLVASRRGADGPFVFPFGEDRGTRFVASNESSLFVQEVNYLPFGQASSSGSPSSPAYTSAQWNGGDALADLGVVQVGARVYDPEIGRFLSRDPLIIPRTATTTNPYAFAFNDPVNFSDPSGLDGESSSTGATAAFNAGVAAGRWLYGKIFGGGSSGPAGPKLLGKDAYDTNRTAVWVSLSATDDRSWMMPDLGWMLPAQTDYDTGCDSRCKSIREMSPDWWDDLPRIRRVELDGSEYTRGRAKYGAIGTAVAVAVVFPEVGAVVGVTQASNEGEALAAALGLRAAFRPGSPSKAGAGGNWATVDEQAGGAVGQLTEVSCGAACGEMVSGISQTELIASAGAPTYAEGLARALGTGWRGGYVGPQQLSKLFRLGRPFVAELYESGESLGHFVVVDGIKRGFVLIRDPSKGGSTYRMLVSEFDRVWTGNAVFR